MHKSMHNLTLLISLFCGVFMMSALSAHRNVKYRVFKGETVPVDDMFPYQVGLLMGSGLWCGGSLISHNFVLTAAHCVIREVGKIRVYTGAIVRRKSDIISVDTKYIYVHKYYNIFTGDNDIALIEIPYVNFTRFTSAVGLPNRNANTESIYGKDVYISGWGSPMNDESLIDTLNYGMMTIIDKSKCSEYHKSDILRSTNICLIPKYKQSDCNGDSGGAAVLPNENIQIGIVSRGGDKFCNSTLPNLYTNVLLFRDWIGRITGL